MKQVLLQRTVSEITYNMINENLIHEVGEDLSPQNKSGRKRYY